MSRSQVIESIEVRSASAPLIVVITEDLSVLGAVREFIRKTNRKLPIIWQTSVLSACQRLASRPAALIILDNRAEAGVTAEALNELHSAAPTTRVVLLGEDAVRL